MTWRSGLFGPDLINLIELPFASGSRLMMLLGRRTGRIGRRIKLLSHSSRAIPELLAVVVLIEGKRSAARCNPDDGDEHGDVDEGVARRFKHVFLADLNARRVVSIDWHQDHQSRLQERGNDHRQNYAGYLDPELVVFEAEDDDEAEDCVREVREDPKLKDGLEFVLHAVRSRIT